MTLRILGRLSAYEIAANFEFVCLSDRLGLSRPSFALTDPLRQLRAEPLRVSNLPCSHFCLELVSESTAHPAALLGGKVMPSERANVIFRHPPTTCVHHCEGILASSVPLIGRLAKPSHGLCIVLWDTATTLVHGSDGPLG